MRIGRLALVVAALTAVMVFVRLFSVALQTSDSPSAYALTRTVDPAGRSYQNGNINTNEDADGDNREADNEDGDNEDADNDEDDFDNDDFDNSEFDFDIPPYVPPSSPSQEIRLTCSRPGQDTLFLSFDQKATLLISRLATSAMHAELLPVINAHEAPQPPGEFVDPLVYAVSVRFCDPIPMVMFPMDAILTIHYSDAELAGRDESRLVIGRLDMSTGRWSPVEQRSLDGGANTVTAIIRESGYYMLWVER